MTIYNIFDLWFNWYEAIWVIWAMYHMCMWVIMCNWLVGFWILHGQVSQVSQQCQPIGHFQPCLFRVWHKSIRNTPLVASCTGLDMLQKQRRNAHNQSNSTWVYCMAASSINPTCGVLLWEAGAQALCHTGRLKEGSTRKLSPSLPMVRNEKSEPRTSDTKASQFDIDSRSWWVMIHE